MSDCNLKHVSNLAYRCSNKEPKTPIFKIETAFTCSLKIGKKKYNYCFN